MYTSYYRHSRRSCRVLISGTLVPLESLLGLRVVEIAVYIIIGGVVFGVGVLAVFRVRVNIWVYSESGRQQASSAASWWSTSPRGSTPARGRAHLAFLRARSRGKEGRLFRGGLRDLCSFSRACFDPGTLKDRTSNTS